MVLGDDLLDARRNNFTAVRFVLASSVIYTHCYWLIHKVEGRDDLSPVLGAPISAFAVDGFFFLSGFLVYPSLLRLGNVPSFLMARLARLWPALALSVALTVLGGLLVTSAAPGDYFSGRTLRFIFGNLSLTFAAYHLTGLDCGTGPCNVNGSLWTLPWEARCYLLLSALGLIGFAKPQLMARLILPTTLVAVLLWSVPLVPTAATAMVGEGTVYIVNLAVRLWGLFALGITAYVFRRRIRLSWPVLALLLVVNVVVHQFADVLVIRALLIGYAVLCFGFLTAKNGAVSAAWPDYSYGMYIFAFPIMIAIVALWPTDSHFRLSLVNLLATLPVAALSWHFVEKPALDWFRRSRSRTVPQPLLQP